jgi:hypothetical protein
MPSSSRHARIKFQNAHIKDGLSPDGHVDPHEKTLRLLLKLSKETPPDDSIITPLPPGNAPRHFSGTPIYINPETGETSERNPLEWGEAGAHGVSIIKDVITFVKTGVKTARFLAPRPTRRVGQSWSSSVAVQIAISTTHGGEAKAQVNLLGRRQSPRTETAIPKSRYEIGQDLILRIKLDWVKVQLVPHSLPFDSPLDVNRHFEIPFECLRAEGSYGDLLLHPHRTTCLDPMKSFHLAPMVHHGDKCHARLESTKDIAGQSFQARLVLSKVALEVRLSFNSRSQVLPKFDFFALSENS